ncbi:hypothetical protein VFPPC_16611 [Pochonia chlamydosporia 170]|uniref:Uncharacterized protein n=1 Tax=Pochonia chlamydosporia 170 TaxID=1380566 RepID=A0A179F9K1_METCM|nr:hypothetical protein VFPPC_16611 [Pochonia chlamydosporia 170]OAQ62118.1 hypothetical protein VFPPC_16611 [Pochonia chlamydosporia 170]
MHSEGNGVGMPNGDEVSQMTHSIGTYASNIGDSRTTHQSTKARSLSWSELKSSSWLHINNDCGVVHVHICQPT